MRAICLAVKAFNFIIIPYLAFYLLIFFEKIFLFPIVVVSILIIFSIAIYIFQDRNSKHAIKLFFCWFFILLVFWISVEKHYYNNYVYGYAPLSFIEFFIKQWQDSILLYLPFIIFSVFIFSMKIRSKLHD